jgi:hypothetical protein
MVGNGVCDTAFDGNALVPFAHGMSLISDDMYKVYLYSDWIPRSEISFRRKYF